MKFRTVVWDSPWPESGGGKIKRGADKHYRLIKSKEQIYEVIRESPLYNRMIGHGHVLQLEPNAHGYCWVTNTYLKWGLWLMDMMGFEYKTNVIWNKPKIGLGQYFRGKHEICLFGVCGKGMDPSVWTGDRTLQSSYDWDYGRDEKGKPVHSKKPDEFYDLVEKRSRGPYLELFARRPRNEKWTCWGPDAGLEVPMLTDEEMG